MFSHQKIFALGLVSALGLFALTSCGASAPGAKASAATPAAKTSQPATAHPTTLDNMSGLVADAKTLAGLDDWHTVRVLDSQIEGDWKDIKGDIEKTNKTNYEAIETHLHDLNSALKETSPDKIAVTSHLDELKTILSGVPQ